MGKMLMSLKGSIAFLEKESALGGKFRRISELGILQVSYILLDFSGSVMGILLFSHLCHNLNIKYVKKKIQVRKVMF